jgi:hypothetical protein
VFTEAERNRYAAWGLCADEFTTTGNFPPQLYVRESRRMQGMYVITENDITGNPSKPDPIMVSSFPIDSHDCQRVVLPDGKVVNEGTIYPVKPAGNPRGYAYHVPYRAILPQAAECDNLLVPVTVTSGPNVSKFSADQTAARPAGSVFREIGTAVLVLGEETVITVGTVGTTGFVILDAIQLVLDPDVTFFIYSESFDGTGNLNGTETTVGGGIWSASTDWKKDGTIAGTTLNESDNAFLEFSPEAGKIYELSATITEPTRFGTVNGWLAIGFTETNQNENALWGNITDATNPWMLYRHDGGNVDTFTGTLGNWLTEDEGNYPGSAVFSIVLNTQASAWTAEWFINGSSVRSETLASNPAINYVGLGRSAGVSGTIENLSLSVIPGPGSGFDVWADNYGGIAVIGPETNDYDGDLYDNLYEYALNGDPTDPSIRGTQPAFTYAGGGFDYVYVRRSDDLNLSYIVQTCPNLIAGAWTNTGYTVTGTNITGGTYDEVTNSVPTIEPQTYIRLQITTP